MGFNDDVIILEKSGEWTSGVLDESDVMDATDVESVQRDCDKEFDDWRDCLETGEDVDDCDLGDGDIGDLIGDIVETLGGEEEDVSDMRNVTGDMMKNEDMETS